MSETPSIGEQDQSQQNGLQGPFIYHVGQQPFSPDTLESDSCKGGACQCHLPGLDRGLD